MSISIQEEYTVEEYRLANVLRVLGFIFALAALGYLLPALVGPNKGFFIHLPFVTNSTVKVSVLAFLAWQASGNIRRYRGIVPVIIWGHIISILSSLAALAWGLADQTVSYTLPFMGALVFPISRVLWGSIALDTVIVILLIVLYRKADKARYRLRYLTPVQFRSLTALAESLIVGKNEIVEPKEIALDADRYLSSFRAKTKWIFKLVLTAMEYYPLLSLRVPLSQMNVADRRKFLENRFYKKTNLLHGIWRDLVRVMIRISKQLAYLGYYNNPKVYESVGYTPFESRPDTQAKKKFYPTPTNKPLQVLQGKDIPQQIEELEADLVIVGSGAGGAIMAHSVLRHNPSLKIIMLERGDHTDSSEMSSDEVDMLSRLYADGALQLSRDFNFQILQGSCVGGSTVINNAVSFGLPQEVFERWNDPQLFDAGLDETKLASSFKYVRQLLDIKDQDEATHKFPFLNKGSIPFAKGISELQLGTAPNEFKMVQANIKECYGCGYCNIGCKYGKKMSMLSTVLPDIQANYGKDALKIIAGCEVDRLHASAKDITSVTASFRDGRKIRVRGKKFVLSAGAISSSLVLIRSGAGNRRVGKDLCFNLGSPITAVFDEVVNAYEGLQISHYLLQRPSRGYIMETWFNPPVSQALTMPGWFDDHFNNMLRYNHLSSVGILVPTESNAEIRDGGLFRRDIKYKPTQTDLARLGDGLTLAAKIFFAGGAKIVMPHTMDYLELKEDQLHIIQQKVLEPGQFTLGTGHPQGGNKLSRDPKKGVIDQEFRVYGYNNLFVADASVFPSSIGVNPQLTVMALADYASEFIAS